MIILTVKRKIAKIVEENVSAELKQIKNIKQVVLENTKNLRKISENDPNLRHSLRDILLKESRKD